MCQTWYWIMSILFLYLSGRQCLYSLCIIYIVYPRERSFNLKVRWNWRRAQTVTYIPESKHWYCFKLPISNILCFENVKHSWNIMACFEIKVSEMTVVYRLPNFLIVCLLFIQALVPSKYICYLCFLLSDIHPNIHNPANTEIFWNSGMPECKLGLNDKVLLEAQGRATKGKAIDLDDIKFHQ